MRSGHQPKGRTTGSRAFWCYRQSRTVGQILIDISGEKVFYLSFRFCILQQLIEDKEVSM